MTIIQRPQIIQKTERLQVNWERRLCTVTTTTLGIADSRCHCWICGGRFKVGDGMWVANTDQGNKVIHVRCRMAQ